MKKIITLVLAVACFATVNAQTSKEEARRVILGESKGSTKNTPTQNPRDVILGGGNGGNNPSSYPGNYPGGSREAQIDQVNREYNAKIQSVRNNPYLSQAEKDRAIRQLENDRAKKIREINNRYYGKDKDNAYKYKKNKGNNGKHLGWEKGKGNPHKNGGSPKGKKG
jgi:hypothetical protein